MAYNDYSTVNASNGFQELFIYTNNVTNGMFTNMTLFAFFLVVMFSTYFSTRRLEGRSNLSVSFAVAGFVTALIATLFSLVDGLINPTTVVICVSVAVVGGVWLFLSNIGD